MVVQLDGALDGHVAGVGRGGWRDPYPDDDAVRVRIARGDAVKLSSDGWYPTLPRFMLWRVTTGTLMPRLTWRVEGLW